MSSADYTLLAISFCGLMLTVAVISGIGLAVIYNDIHKRR